MPPLPQQIDPASLAALPEKEFDKTVFVYVTSGERTATHELAFHSGVVVERVAAALNRLRLAFEYRQAEARRRGIGQQVAAAGRVLDLIRVERKIVQPLANEARERRSAKERGRGPGYRAMVRLSKMYPKEFLALKREEQARDAAREGSGA